MSSVMWRTLLYDVNILTEDNFVAECITVDITVLSGVCRGMLHANGVHLQTEKKTDNSSAITLLGIKTAPPPVEYSNDVKSLVMVITRRKSSLVL